MKWNNDYCSSEFDDSYDDCNDEEDDENCEDDKTYYLFWYMMGI